MHKVVYSLVILTLLFSCRSEPVTLSEESTKVSVITLEELCDNALSFHEKRIEVTGIYLSGFEISALFPIDRKQEDCEVWVGLANDLESQLIDFDWDLIQERKLRIQGIYNAHAGGHLGAYQGTIFADFIKTVD